MNPRNVSTPIITEAEDAAKCARRTQPIAQFDEEPEVLTFDEMFDMIDWRGHYIETVKIHRNPFGNFELWFRIKRIGWEYVGFWNAKR